MATVASAAMTMKMSSHGPKRRMICPAPGMRIGTSRKIDMAIDMTADIAAPS